MLSLNTINTPTSTLPHVAVDAEIFWAQTKAEFNLLINHLLLTFLYMKICILTHLWYIRKYNLINDLSYILDASFKGFVIPRSA